MTTNDAFTSQIIDLVRRMPDDAILALVKNQLAGVKGLSQPLAAAANAAPVPGAKRRGRPPGSKSKVKPGPKPAAKPAAKAVVAKAVVAKAVAAPKAKPGPKPKAAKKAAPKKSAAPKRAKAGRGGGAGRQEAMSVVERIVKSGGGLAASDIAKAAGIPQSRASAALKELKLAKRIFQGGDRRFARYAGDARSAEQASLNARKNAAGPQLKKRRG